MISVIVPVYNIEKYIKRCVESIIGQSYKDLEIILVDDGSTDDCGQICDQYAIKDSRIKVIHQENGGLSAARNSGLDIAQGEYIGFVDGDDYINPNMYEILLDVLLKTGADMSICDFIEVYENEEKRNDSLLGYKVNVMTGSDIYEMVTKFNTMEIVAWSKLYSRRIFEGLRFKKGRLHEDQWIIPYVSERCRKVAKCDAKLYYYVSRSSAISKTKLDEKRMWDMLDALKNSCIFFKDKCLYDEQKLEARHLCNHLIDYYSNADSYFDEAQVVKKQLVNYFREVMSLCDNVFSWRQVVYKSFELQPQLGIMIKKFREKSLWKNSGPK